MELCSMLYGSLNGRGAWGRTDTCICMAESLHCSPVTTTTLLISYTPIQNKKFQRKDYSESDISIVKNEIDICHNKCQNYVVIVIWSNTIL